jgi:hypothetical protein
MLDGDAEGASRQEAAKIVLHIDPEREPDRTKACVQIPDRDVDFKRLR